MNNYKIFGVIVGFLVGVAVAILVMYKTRNNGKLKLEYDERQELIRHKGFKYGYYTLAGYLAFGVLLDIAEIELPMTNAVFMFIGIGLSLLVIAIQGIITECYFAMNENRTSVLVAFLVIGLINLAIGFSNLAIGNCFSDGKLSFGAINFICGIMILVIFIVAVIKGSSNGGGSNEES